MEAVIGKKRQHKNKYAYCGCIALCIAVISWDVHIYVHNFANVRFSLQYIHYAALKSSP